MNGAALRRENDRLWAILRMVRDTPSLAKVKEIMGHDLIHGVIACELHDAHRETGDDYFDLRNRIESPSWSAYVQARLAIGRPSGLFVRLAEDPP